MLPNLSSAKATRDLVHGCLLPLFLFNLAALPFAAVPAFVSELVFGARFVLAVLCFFRRCALDTAMMFRAP